MADRKERPVVIVGAGMAGMMAALFLRQRYPEKSIVIIESTLQPGGNYRCVNYPGHGKFDQGMRLLYETGIPEFDVLLHSLLAESQWHIFSENHKDIAGIYWNGKLQTHSPYIDLRNLPPAIFEQCKIELMEIIAHSPTVHPNNIRNYLDARFGPTASGYLCAVLEKLYALPVERLDMSALHQPAMDRVILFDSDELQPLLHNASVRARLAWPNQLTLPPLRNFAQKALYPKNYGMDVVIEALHNRLKEERVDILLGDAVVAMDITQRRLEALITREGKRIQQIEHLYWTGSLTSMASLLSCMPSHALPELPEAILVHMNLAELPAKMEELYHFYCFDAEFYTFRVTHYANYCPDAKQADGYPVCVELWHFRGTDAQAADTAIAELLRMGIADRTDKIKLKGIARIPNVHSYCTRDAVRAVHDLRERIMQQKPDNVSMAGVFAEDGHMLLYEIWRGMVNKINQNSW